LLPYPATIPAVQPILNHLASLIRTHRRQRRSRWRRLDRGPEALLALAHLRNGETLTRPAAGFEVGIAAARRYIRGAMTMLAATADDVQAAMSRTRQPAYAICHGAP
jgi:hypothetical protein